MKMHHSSDNIGLYNESRRWVWEIIEQAKRQYEKNVAVESNYSAKMFYKYINKKMNI